ncbi:MAG: serine/threonine-protein kinase, partial [Kofleriaceae bacterium]
LKRLGRLTAIDAVRLAKQIASSLASVHDKGVIHRDLKPDNVFLVGDPAVTGGERTKLLDFGIAKLTQHDTQFKTQTGAMVGTPAYMSPEQCRATPIDHRSDIYSLGVMLFVMVTGRPPFIGEGSGDVLISHVRDAPPRPTSIQRDVPREVENIIMRCLEKQPDARYASAAELVAALTKAESFLASGGGFEPTSEIVVTYDPAPILERPRRRRGWVIGGVALAVAGTGIAVVLATRGSDPPARASDMSPSTSTTSPTNAPAPPAPGSGATPPSGSASAAPSAIGSSADAVPDAGIAETTPTPVTTPAQTKPTQTKPTTRTKPTQTKPPATRTRPKPETKPAPRRDPPEPHVTPPVIDRGD